MDKFCAIFLLAGISNAGRHAGPIYGLGREYPSLRGGYEVVESGYSPSHVDYEYDYPEGGISGSYSNSNGGGSNYRSGSFGLGNAGSHFRKRPNWNFLGGAHGGITNGIGSAAGQFHGGGYLQGGHGGGNVFHGGFGGGGAPAGQFHGGRYLQGGGNLLHGGFGGGGRGFYGDHSGPVQYQAHYRPIYHGHGGEVINKEIYNAGDKKLSDGVYKKYSGKKNVQEGNDQNEFSQNGAGLQSSSAEKEYFNNDLAKKKIDEDGKFYKGGQQYNQQGNVP